MIPVRMAAEPQSFDVQVRQRGRAAIEKLLGKSLPPGGKTPKVTYAREEDIPSTAFPPLWTKKRSLDGNSTLDDMMKSYHQLCAYLGMYLEHATGNPSVDHYIPVTRNAKLVYEWSNYRLCAACVNGAKGIRDVIDPFSVEPGWFELDLDTYFVRGGPALPANQHARLEATLNILNLRPCVLQRGDTLERYRTRELSFRYLTKYAPFIAVELVRQGRVLPEHT